MSEAIEAMREYIKDYVPMGIPQADALRYLVAVEGERDEAVALAEELRSQQRGDSPMMEIPVWLYVAVQAVLGAMAIHFAFKCDRLEQQLRETRGPCAACGAIPFRSTARYDPPRKRG